MAQAARDQNFVPTLLGVSSVDGTTPVTLYADPTTHRLLTDAASSGITIGTTTITGGTNTRILYDNSGVVGEYTLTGTGTVVAMQASPTFTGAVTLAAGSAGTPSLNFSDAATGFYRFASNQVGLAYNGALGIIYEGGSLGQIFTSGFGLGFSSNATVAGKDTSITRVSAGLVGIGTGTAGSIAGSLSLAGLTASSTVTTLQLITSGGNGANDIKFGTRGYISGSSDGVFALYDTATTNFGRLQFGGTTSSFPSIKRSSATLAVRLADDSADANLTAAALTLSGGLTSTTVQNLLGTTRINNINNSDNSITVFALANTTGNVTFGGTLFTLNGTTASFPALKRSTTTVAFRLADDSADAGISASTGVFSGTVTTPLISTTNNAITAVANAATVPVTSTLSTVTNNSAATLTITITTAGAVNRQKLVVCILDATAAAQTITWVNTENSTVSAPATSNGSTTLPLTVGFMYNSATSLWRCVASA